METWNCDKSDVARFFAGISRIIFESSTAWLLAFTWNSMHEVYLHVDTLLDNFKNTSWVNQTGHVESYFDDYDYTLANNSKIRPNAKFPRTRSIDTHIAVRKTRCGVMCHPPRWWILLIFPSRYTSITRSIFRMVNSAMMAPSIWGLETGRFNRSGYFLFICKLKLSYCDFVTSVTDSFFDELFYSNVKKHWKVCPYCYIPFPRLWPP